MSESVDKFVDDLAKRDFIVFAGTGVAENSWQHLLEAFKNKEPSVVSEDVIDALESEYPKIAQSIYENLREIGKENRYYEILKEELSRKKTNWFPQEFDIVDTARHVVTTNFDDGLESALNRILEREENVDSIIQSLPELNYSALSKEYSVSYLHGRVNEQCVVFKEDDYKIFYPSQFGGNCGCDNLERFLRNIYEECTIVFIGFSFADRYFLGAIQKIHGDIQHNDAIGEAMKPLYKSRLEEIQHYVCLQEFDKARETRELIASQRFQEGRVETIVAAREKRDRELASTLESIKIKVIRYKEHKDWTQWFENIRKLRRISRHEKI